MATLSKLNGTAIASISKIDGTAIASLSKFDWLDIVTDFHTVSVDLDWSTEYFQVGTASDRGITNARTIGYFGKLDSLSGIFYDMRPSSGTGNIIALEGSWWWGVVVHRATNFSSWWSTIKDYHSLVTPSTSTIYSAFFTRDGTSLKWYLDATEDTTKTTLTDTTGTMTNTNRKLAFWANLAHTWFYDGLVSCLGIWNAALSGAAITSLHNSWAGYNQDRRTTIGSYSPTNIQHYYCFGKNLSNIGEDLVWSLDFSLTNITSADVVAFA